MATPEQLAEAAKAQELLDKPDIYGNKPKDNLAPSNPPGSDIYGNTSQDISNYTTGMGATSQGSQTIITPELAAIRQKNATNAYLNSLNPGSAPAAEQTPVRQPISFERTNTTPELTGQSIPEQTAAVVNNPTPSATKSGITNGVPSPVSLNARQKELLDAETVNEAPVLQAHTDITGALTDARTVADEVTKQKNEMLTDHSEIMHNLAANQELHSTMARNSADTVAGDIRNKMRGIKDINSNPGVFTDRANFELKDLKEPGVIGLKILGAIGQAAAMAGGAYGAGITHSRNFAMDIINEQIAKNIDAQKSNNEKKWQAINVTHQLGNDQQLKYAHMLEQDNRNELAERYRVQDYLTYLTEKTGNADAKIHLGELNSANAGKIADVQNQMAGQRKGFLDTNANLAIQQAAHAQALMREETHRAEDRHDKYVEHAISKSGGQLSPDEAEGRWTSYVQGTKYIPDPNAPKNVPPELAVADSNGNILRAVSPEAQKATEPLFRAIRNARGDLEAYKKNPTDHNYDALVLSTGQIAGLKRAPTTPNTGIWNGIKNTFGVNTGHTIADMVPPSNQMHLNKNAANDYEAMLNRHEESIKLTAVGKGPPPPYNDTKKSGQ